MKQYVKSTTDSRVVWECPECGLKRHHTIRSGGFPQQHACSHCPWNCCFEVALVSGRFVVFMTRYKGGEQTSGPE